jgi:5-formyltetrahydrofolate cyclo-ligase
MEPDPMGLSCQRICGLLVVPGVGFDHCVIVSVLARGIRSLSRINGGQCLSVGLCHEFQLLERLCRLSRMMS